MSGAAAITQPGAAQMLIDQSSARAVIDWQGFSIGENASVTFNHQLGASSATLNRVVGTEQSVINGMLQAQGQVYLINSQGILFGPNAQVNVGGLVASALNISNEVFEKGLTSLIVNPRAADPEHTQPGAAFVWEGDAAGFRNVKVEVQEGARIRTTAGGRVLLFAPQVVNQGRIESPEGQTILGAGAKVYLTAPLDSALRGFLIEVDPYSEGSTVIGGKVTNKAAAAWTETSGDSIIERVYQIVAKRGNVTLAGFEVEQSGRILATSTVDQNGSITIQARDTWTRNERREVAGSSDPVFIPRAERTGSVVIGAGSETSVLPETASSRSRPGNLGAITETDVLPTVESSRAITDDQSLVVPTITISGRSVRVSDGAAVLAPGGKISFLAQEAARAPLDQDELTERTVPGFQIIPDNSTGSADTYDNRGVRVYVGRDVRLDVAGVRDVALSVARNVVEVDLRGPELKDAPVQRDGILRNSKIYLDLRTSPDIVDASGFRSQVQRGVGERLAAGGSIVLQSEGDVVVREGSVLDVSGGWLDYAAATVGVTLLESGGQGTAFADASADRIYDRIVNVQQQEAGYREGRDAGTIQVWGGRVAVDGTLSGTAVSGLRQQDAATQPKGGRLLLGDAADPAGTLYAQLRIASEAVRLPSDFVTDQAIGRLSTLPSTWFGAGNLTRLEAYTFGTVTQTADAGLHLGPGGSAILHGGSTVLAGSIVAPGGVIDVDALGSLTVSSGTYLSTAGTWTNERKSALAGTVPGIVTVNGGSIALRGTDVTLSSGSRLDVSAGLSYLVNGRFRYGDAGSIALRTRGPILGEVETSGAIRTRNLVIDDTVEMSGFGFGRHVGSEGGSLELSASFLTIGGPENVEERRTLISQLAGDNLLGSASAWTDQDKAAGRARPGELHLTSLWDDRGFSNYDLQGADGVLVMPDAVVAPLAAFRVVQPDARGAVAGVDVSSVAAVSRSGLADLQPAGSIALSALRNDPLLSSVSVHQGARVDAGVLGNVTISAASRILIDGTVRAAGGSIDIRLPQPTLTDVYDATRKILLGEQAVLDVSGVRMLDSVSRPLLDGRVLDGGSVVLDAANGALVTQRGSLIDVRGTSGEVALATTSNGAVIFGSVQRVDSDAGRISLAAREALLLGGRLEAARTGSARGGEITVTMDREGRSFETPADATLASRLAGPRRLQVSLRSIDVLDSMSLSGSVPDTLIGLGIVEHAVLEDSGADIVALSSEHRIEFLGSGADVAQQSLSLSPARELRLEAPNIVVEDPNGFHPGTPAARTLIVNLSAAYVALGPVRTARQSDSLRMAAAGGPGTIAVSAVQADLVGNLATQGVGTLNFVTSEDVRLRGVASVSTGTDGNAVVALPGSLSTRADVSVTARSVHPETYAKFTLDLGDRTFSVASGGEAAPVLSAGGVLRVIAGDIVQGGSVVAPMGSISFEASRTITLTGGSLTSTSAHGQELLFGRTILNGRRLVYSAAGGDGDLAMPEKRISLTAPQLDLAAGAVVDLSGGGTLTAWEFVPGTGGSKDVLDPAVAANRFVILPGYASRFAPHDEQIMTGVALDAGTALRIEQDVPGLLEAGDYTLLPARYALLPGAIVVTLDTAQLDTLPAGSIRPQDGSSLVLGRLLTPGADGGYVADARSFRVDVASADWALARSQFEMTTPDSFFGTTATTKSADAGALVLDAANAVTGGTSALVLEAEIRSAAASGGRGLWLDVSANRLMLTADGGAAPSGWVALDAGRLGDIGAASMLIGGTRAAQDATTLLRTRAQEVVIDTAGGSAMTVPEFLAVAGSVVVRGDSVIAPSGSAAATAYRVSGDGSLLRVSGGSQSALTRTNVTGTSGSLVIESGATLTGRSIVLDATRETRVAPGVLDFGANPGTALTLGATRISIGDAPAGTEGSILAQSDLDTLSTLTELRLRSYTTVDLHPGSAGLTLGSATLGYLGIEAAGIAGYGSSGVRAVLQAGTVSLSNPAGIDHSASVRTDLAQGAGTLRIEASTIRLEDGAGAFGVSGFTKSELVATADLVGAGTAILQAAGDLEITSARIVGDVAADTTITATGVLTTIAGPGVSSAAWEGFGNRWTLQGASVLHGGRIEAPAGRIELVATSSGGRVELQQGSVLSAPGFEKTFDTVAVATSAGTIVLSSGAGNVVAQVGSTIDVHGAGAADAGILRVSAATGTADIRATLSAAAQDGRAGQFSLDAAAVSGLADLAAALRTGGFTESVDIRQRSGDITLSAIDIVRAREIRLAADNGKVDIAGTLDASGPKGGRIEIFAGNGGASNGGTLVLRGTARLLANATEYLDFADGTRGEGGTVILGVGGTRAAADDEAAALDRASRLILLDGSLIDVSTATGDAGSGVRRGEKPWETLPRGGQVVLRAPRIESGLGTSNPDDIAVTSRADGVVAGTLDASISGAESIVLEAVQVSRFGESGVTLTGGTSASSVLNTLRTATNTFMANAGAIETRLGIGADARYHLRPGIEIGSQGDIVLPQDWDLRSRSTAATGFYWRYGATAAATPGEPGLLTLRAAGRVTLNGSISDGFNATTGTNVYPTVLRTANLVQSTSGAQFADTEGDSWSYRFAGGADLGAANPLSVLDGSGMSGRDGRVELASAKVVRTGAGSIDIAAATSLVLGVDASGEVVDSATSAIYVAGLGDRPDNHADVGPDGRNQFLVAGGFSGASAPRYPLRGGDIRIVAGGDIEGTGGNRWVNDWLFRIGAVDENGNLESATNDSGYFRPTWWTQFQYFSHGIGAFGGGDVNVTSGGSIRNLGVASGTSGRLPGEDGAAPDMANLKVLGGGDVTVSAAGDILTSVFHAGRGDIRVAAGRDIGAARTTSEGKPIYSLVSVGEGNARLEAGGSLGLAAVLNATFSPQPSTNASNASRVSYFSTLAADSAVELVARDGVLALDNGGGAPLTSSFGIPGAGTDVAALTLYAGSLRATAMSGDPSVGSAMTLAPAAGGQLDLFASGAISSAGRINMSALPVSALPTAAAPSNEFGDRLAVVTGADYFSRSAYGPESPHSGDTEPVRIIAQGGDVSGPGGSIFLQLPKRFVLQAAGDLKGGWISAQHLATTDWSTISVGGDIVYDFAASNETLQIGGPGTLFVTAGGSIDLGPSRGIVSRGNFNNPYLPEEGADIVLMVGTGEARYDGLLLRYTDPALRPLPEDLASSYNVFVRTEMSRRVAQGESTDAEVRAAYLALKSVDPAAAPIPVASVNSSDAATLAAMRATLKAREASGSFGVTEARAAYAILRATDPKAAALPDSLTDAYDGFVLAFMREWSGNGTLTLQQARDAYTVLRSADAAVVPPAGFEDILFRYTDPAGSALPSSSIAAYDSALLAALRLATGNSQLTPAQARMEYLLFGSSDPAIRSTLAQDKRYFHLTDPVLGLLPQTELEAYNGALALALGTGSGADGIAAARAQVSKALERPTVADSTSTATEETYASQLRSASESLESAYGARLLQAMRHKTGDATLDMSQARSAFAASLPVSATSLAGFLEGSAGALEPALRQLFFREIHEAGVRGASTNAVSDYRAGDFAILDLFPNAPGSLTEASDARANLSLYRSQVKSEQGGDIEVLVPGGFVNVGVTDLQTTKAASELGILTTRGGAIRAVVSGDFQVNTSRVFTLQGGDIELWSSFGSIDAGRGARTTSATPPPQIIIRGDQIILDTSASVAGAGIGTLLAREDVAPGSVYLFAPRGAIEASDAPIRSANAVIVGAQTVRGADNIVGAGGVTLSSVPAVVPAAPPPPPPSNTATDAAKAVEKTTEKAAEAGAAQNFKPSFITVQVIALGDEDDKRSGTR
ncbi:MAG: filamentous hemagglutinin family protein [Betaproteobacteria bacterium]|nr:filamentous hemagglutinin family protein [Betaproteobacteria bacterium]